jgi:DNA-binding NtrC family response regulator
MSGKRLRILVAEDEKKLLGRYRELFRDHDLETATSCAGLRRLLDDGGPFDLIVLDRFLEGEEDAFESIETESFARHRGTRILVVSGKTGDPKFEEFSKRIAWDPRLLFPLAKDDEGGFEGKVRRHLEILAMPPEARKPAEDERRRLSTQYEHHIGAEPDDFAIITADPGMLDVLRTVNTVADRGHHLLILGESGTGKELVARRYHRKSGRPGNLFFMVNLAAVPETLIESQLFGAEKGSFTGATARIPGIFERAKGGTLFLDEIGDASPDMQVKILRVIENKEYQPIGGATVPADVRLVFATNKPLEEEVGSARFREDLYYRIRGCTVNLPPLRERCRKDKELLMEHFFRQNDEGARILIEPEGVSRLCGLHFPGNVRELRDLILDLSMKADDGIIHASMIPSTEPRAGRAGAESAPAAQAWGPEEVRKHFTGLWVEMLDSGQAEATLKDMNEAKRARGEYPYWALALAALEHFQGNRRLYEEKYGIPAKGGSSAFYARFLGPQGNFDRNKTTIRANLHKKYPDLPAAARGNHVDLWTALSRLIPAPS